MNRKIVVLIVFLIVFSIFGCYIILTHNDLENNGIDTNNSQMNESKNQSEINETQDNQITQSNSDKKNSNNKKDSNGKKDNIKKIIISDDEDDRVHGDVQDLGNGTIIVTM